MLIQGPELKASYLLEFNHPVIHHSDEPWAVGIVMVVHGVCGGLYSTSWLREHATTFWGGENRQLTMTPVYFFAAPPPNHYPLALDPLHEKVPPAEKRYG